MTESQIQSEVMRLCGSLPNVRAFRNNVGFLRPNQVIRPMRFGLYPGSSDIIGWKSFVIRPEHVGRKFAQFLSIEVKTNTGRLSPTQRNWLDAVDSAGGFAFVANDAELAREMLL